MVEQLCIPRVWLVFLLFHIVEVRSIVEHLGDDEGTFPGRSKLVRLLLLLFASEIPQWVTLPRIRFA